MDAYTLAPIIVDTYIASYEDANADEVTLSAFDLERVGPLTESVDALATAMIDDMDQSYSAIGQSRSFVNVFAPAYPEEFNAIDLGDFARLLPEQGASEPINQCG
jgi:hypothetical protein